MQIRIISTALLAALLTGALITAQAEPKKAQDPHGQVKDAAATKVQTGAPLEFAVSGLTEANADKVEQSLTAMQAPAFVCEGCKHQQATAGRCSPCSTDLKAMKVPVFFEVVPSFADETIRVTPMAAATLRYSDLVAALTKSAIEIDATQFRLAGNSRLVLRGGTADDVKVVEKALTDAKLFDKVKAQHDPATGEIHVMVQASKTPPLRSLVLSTLDGLETKAKLADVIWGPLPVTKA